MTYLSKHEHDYDEDHLKEEHEDGTEAVATTIKQVFRGQDADRTTSLMLLGQHSSFIIQRHQ